MTIFNFLLQAPSGVNSYSYAMSGGLVLSSVESPTSFVFNAEFDFSWNVSDNTLYWYRVECECVVEDDPRSNIHFEDKICATGSNPGSTVGSFKYIAATTVSDLCQRLKRGFLTQPLQCPLKKVQRFTRPVMKSDVLRQEEAGVDHSVNVLIDVPFESVQDCLDFAVDIEGDIQVEVRTSLHDDVFDYSMSGGFLLAGSMEYADEFSSSAAERGGFVLGGSMSTDFLEQLDVELTVNTTITSLEVTFSETFGSSLTESSDTISTNCDCNSLPLLLLLTHNFDQSGVLDNFMRSNGLSLPSELTLNYRSLRESWQQNLHFTGIANDGRTKERWNILFDWQCDEDVAGIDLGNFIWKFSAIFTRMNLTTLQDFVSRFVFTFPKPVFCPLNTLDFDFTYDTQTGIATASDGEVKDVVIHDEIGLFKSRYWMRNPDLTIRVSASDSDSRIRRFELNSIFP